MTTLEILTVIFVPILLILAVVLAMAETVITRMSRARADSLTEVDGEDASDAEVDERATRLSALVHDRVRSLAPVWLVFTAALLGAATLTTLAVWERFGGVGTAIAFAVSVVVVFAFVYLWPRGSALTQLDDVGLRVAGLVSGLGVLGLLVSPMVRLVGRTTEGDNDEFRATPVSEAELLALTGQAAEDESIDPEEQKLIESVLEFGDTKVASVMVPRTDMVTVSDDATITEGLELVVEHGFSRFPVVGEGIDDIVGVAHAKDMLAASLDGRGEERVDKHMRAPHHVPETKQVPKLQREMQAETFHLAIVVDEYGGTAGVVSLEDLLEELVGEIVDEFDVEEPMIEVLTDGARVNGKVSLSHLEDLLGEKLPEGDWSTVGGLIFSTLGHVPEAGERIELPNHQLVVERVQGRRIARVHLSRLAHA